MNRILCVDIGGTGIKAVLFHESGSPLSERIRIPTPRPASPNAILKVIETIAAMEPIQKKFDRISAGFPGVIKNGVSMNAPNLSPSWKNFSIQTAIENRFGVPTRVVNDADAQGLGACQGKGLELTITLGTGIGSGLVYNGALIPNVEFGHHPFRHGETYEEQLGKAALDDVGKQRWNTRIRRMIPNLFAAFNPDALYLGGGNTKHLFPGLPANVHLVSNNCGLFGGVRLWFPKAIVQSPDFTAYSESSKEAS
jgi:polyphosphate glucokinase